jgi:Zn-dependent protease
MGRSLRIGTAFGIGLYVHWSFLVVPALVIFSTSSSGLETLLLVAGLAVALFGCVLLHELGHALMARRFGIGTRDITLFPIGGVARLERMSEHPGEEIAIAVAGPLVNVVIAAGLWIGMALAGLGNLPFMSIDELLRYGSVAHVALAFLFQINFSLVMFNLIPAFPMDGGRVFRAILSIGFGRLRGTEIAVGVAKVVAMLFIAAGVLAFIPFAPHFGSPMLAVIGLFVMAAGNQELAMLRYQDRRRRYAKTLDSVPVVEAVHPAQPVQPNFSGFTWDARAGAWIEWREGRVVGATYVNCAGPQW